MTVEWKRYESVLNVAFATSSAWIVCPYDARELPAEVVADAERTHPARLTGCEALRAAVSEVADHIMRHGSGRATIRLWVESGSVRCDIHEPAGRITDPFIGYLPPTLDPAPGDGLWLARQLCQVVETRSGYCGATVRLRISPPQAVTAPRRQGITACLPHRFPFAAATRKAMFATFLSFTGISITSAFAEPSRSLRHGHLSPPDPTAQTGSAGCAPFRSTTGMPIHQKNSPAGGKTCEKLIFTPPDCNDSG